MQDLLTSDESRLWDAWKTIGETVRGRVGQEVANITGLSEPDYVVLSRLEDNGGGELRQQTLAELMQWSKSRLSHHLTRMEERGMVQRQPAKNGAGILVTMRPAGQEALNRARPVHAGAVRRHLFERLTPAELRMLEAIATRMEADENENDFVAQNTALEDDHSYL